ncbi:hypothetical protein C0995_000417 [Termitomyces sp. Mi166|nr:hypothetical protein C0995_000417 [Termitomyces sp. Mi166\
MQEEEREDFIILIEFTPELLAQLLPRLTDGVKDEGLEGGKTHLASNKPFITLGFPIRSNKAIHSVNSILIDFIVTVVMFRIIRLVELSG